MKPAHVEQRHLADDAAEEVGPHGIHVAHEQAAVAASFDAEVRGRRHLPADEVFRHRDKVFIGPRPLLLKGRLVPGGAEFAAAADVGDHVDVFLFEPGRAGDRLIAGQQRDLESAVAVEQRGRGAVERKIVRPDLEVGHPRAVLRNGLVLSQLQPPRVEERRRLLELLRSRAPHRAERERRGLERARRDEEEVVGFDVIDRDRAAGADLRHARQRLPPPLAVAKCEREEPVAHVVERRDENVVFRGGEARQRRAFRGLEEHMQRAVAGEEPLEVGRQQAARLERFSSGLPVAPQFDEQPLAVDGGIGVVGLVYLYQGATTA